MNRFALIAAAVLAVTPGHANTWVTIPTTNVSGSEFPPTNGSLHRQVDVKSLVRLAGWTHINTRSCKESEAHCRSTTAVSVHCGKALYKDSILTTPLRRMKGDESWSANQIRKETRGNESWSVIDERTNEVFNFLCSH